MFSWLTRTLLACALMLALAPGTLGAAAPEADASRTSDYISRAVVAARAVRAEHGVPVSVTVAQSILESAWGRSGLSTKRNNYFGIKCSALRSPYQSGCTALPSAEYVAGIRDIYVSRFRTYTSMTKSFLDYGRLLARADRYRKAFSYPHDPNRFITEVAKAGYATDPRYAALVISLMRQYELYRYDLHPAAIVPSAKLGKTSAKVRKAFLKKVTPLARAAQASTGVPASALIAMAIDATNWGRSKPARRAKNYLGRVSTGTKLRVYHTVAASFHDAATTLATHQSYTGTRSARRTADGFARALQKARWSTEKSYASDLRKLIKTHRLTGLELPFRGDLVRDDRGARVKALQLLLTSRGFKLPSSGWFGPLTHKAVKAFQAKHKLPVSGRADPRTMATLIRDLRQGSRGPAVTALHVLLRAEKLTPTTGDLFGKATVKAVRAWQKKVKMRVSGGVGVVTWSQLFAPRAG